MILKKVKRFYYLDPFRFKNWSITGIMKPSVARYPRKEGDVYSHFSQSIQYDFQNKLTW